MSHFGMITAGDVIAEQKRTLASAQATDQSVQACAGLDPATKAAWATFYAGLTAWCQTPIVNFWAPWNPSGAVVVTGDTGNTMMGWEAQLQAWQQRLSGPCKGAPGLSTFDPNPAGEQATQWLRWGAVIVGFGATAYIVGSIARLIPSPAPRAPHDEPPRDNPVRSLCPSGSEVQSLLFPASWTPDAARRWARAHNFKGGHVERMDTTLRIRQHDPSRYRRIRTIPLGGSGVRATVGWRSC